eukprot:TRINITY_DN1666_c0_g1_i3.p1 TRINITY_DN1666_c0_g1~~TRINITY_DN1666_c0_g1_i3.p1  ORF type:complete len:190 (+),score=31.31 TRINITY_DN1666_c0_g1_i3:578-1147(+)
MDGGTLKQFIFNDQPISIRTSLQIMLGVAEGLKQLHDSNVIHRDIAARNILLDKNKKPKLADFGLARFLDSGNKLATIGKNNIPVRWMAPESLRHEYSTASDIWSFGILVWEIVARSKPHKNEKIGDLIDKIRDEGYTPRIPSSTHNTLRLLMLQCWEYDAKERPSVDDVRNLLKDTLNELSSQTSDSP